MKLVILAGGRRSAISEVGEGIPKPMIEIGDRPLLWHIMKHASQYGIDEFIICGGYKINMIKEYFQDFYLYQSDIEIDTGSNEVKILKKKSENWKVTVVDTGLMVSPSKRIKQIQKYIKEDMFCVTYGDCLTDIPYNKLLSLHEEKGRMATMGVAHPAGRKITFSFDKSGEFRDTNNICRQGNTEAWTSAGVFAFSTEVFEYLDTDLDIEEILISYGRDRVFPYQHVGFCMSIETLRDKAAAEQLWVSGNAPWVKDI